MQLSSFYRLNTGLAALLVAGAALGATALAEAPKPSKNPQPVVRLPLEALGFPGFSKNFIDAGASMLTVHFADDDHLLLTYSLRGLVERTAEDVPDDEPRAVAALLIETRTGKVVARARWHLHDHGQYLWNLGGGRFLLRVRNSLRAIAPLENLASGNAFREMPMLRLNGKLDQILVSAEGDLLTVETSPFPKKAEPRPPGAVTFSHNETAPPPPSEQINFIRVVGKGTEESPLVAVNAGVTRARGPGQIPVNGRGYLFAAQANRAGNWNVQFDGFGGGDPVKLAPVNSSCPPRFQFVGLGQFVAFTCRGAEDRFMLSSFDFVPRETWEEPFSGPIAFPYFVSAPRSGRFAFSRELTDTALLPGAAASPFAANGGTDVPATRTQEIRVYQAESGDLLLKVVGSPSLKAGQDFDLSSDGMSALVLRNGAIEVYHLPELKKEDRDDLAEVKAHDPAVVTADRLEVRRVMKHAAAAEEPPVDTASANGAVAPSSGVAAPAGSAPAEANTIVNGDAPVMPHRSAPSLLTPGETPDSATSPK